MKKITLISAVCFLLGVSASHAGIGIFGSHWSQRDGDNVLGAGVGFYPVFVPLELRGTYYESTSAPGGGRFRAVPIDGGLSLVLTPLLPARLAVMGGASYYILDPDQGSLDNKFGWYAGGRVEARLHAGTSIFGELMYRRADFSNVPGDFSGVAINLGLMF